MSSNISFHESTRKLKIDITTSCLETIIAIFLSLIFLLVSLFLLVMGLGVLINAVTGVFPEGFLNIIFHLIFYFMLGIFLLVTGILGTLTLVHDIYCFLLRRKRASLEINCQRLKLSWSEEKEYFKLIDHQLTKPVKYVTKVRPFTDTLIGSAMSTRYQYNVHYCLIEIHGHEYEFGNSCGLSEENAHWLADNINLFLKKVK